MTFPVLSSGRKSRSLLGDKARSVGVSEEELTSAFFKRMESGAVIDCLSIQAQAKLCDWIENKDLLCGGEFGIVIRISNKVERRCVCCVDMSGDEPLVKIVKSEFCAPNGRRDVNGLPTFIVQSSWLDPAEIMGYAGRPKGK